jgi:hypothetical protein
MSFGYVGAGGIWVLMKGMDGGEMYWLDSEGGVLKEVDC